MASVHRVRIDETKESGHGNGGKESLRLVGEGIITQEELAREGLLRRMENFCSAYFRVGWGNDVWKHILKCLTTGPDLKGHYDRKMDADDFAGRARDCYQAAMAVGGFFTDSKKFRKLTKKDMLPDDMCSCKRKFMEERGK